MDKGFHSLPKAKESKQIDDWNEVYHKDQELYPLSDLCLTELTLLSNPITSGESVLPFI